MEVGGWAFARWGMTADEIVAANVAARGGLQAWRAVRTLRMTGQMDVGREMQVPFTLLLERPAKMRLEFLFDGEMVVRVFDGKSGWVRRPWPWRAGAGAAEPCLEQLRLVLNCGGKDSRPGGRGKPGLRRSFVPGPQRPAGGPQAPRSMPCTSMGTTGRPS